eukprot:scaffold537_cov180-Ochromonas_danica.AAC.73
MYHTRIGKEDRQGKDDPTMIHKEKRRSKEEKIWEISDQRMKSGTGGIGKKKQIDYRGKRAIDNMYGTSFILHSI